MDKNIKKIFENCKKNICYVYDNLKHYKKDPLVIRGKKQGSFTKKWEKSTLKKDMKVADEDEDIWDKDITYWVVREFGKLSM